MKRIAGDRAHIFFWLSGHLYDEDPSLSWLDTGIFEGVKFHELETPWFKDRRSELISIMGKIKNRKIKVQFHSWDCTGCHPKELSEIAMRFPSIHFDFAHCRPMGEMASVMAKCTNVWTDTAYLPRESYAHLKDYDWSGRLMFGSDLPVWQAHERVGLTARYRQSIAALTLPWEDADLAFKRYLE